MDEYEKKATDFLQGNGLKIRITRPDSKPPAWNEDHAGPHYRITLSRKGGGRISFDFWGSVRDAELGKEPTAYGVLACISSDVYCPETFEDFCGEYGYEMDSRRDFQTFQRVAKFAGRLREFFTEKQQEQLAQIS